MALYQNHPCGITDGPQYDDEPRYEPENDEPTHDDIERMIADRELGSDKDGVDDDAYELRRTIRDMFGEDLPALARRQAG